LLADKAGRLFCWLEIVVAPYCVKTKKEASTTAEASKLGLTPKNHWLAPN